MIRMGTDEFFPPGASIGAYSIALLRKKSSMQAASIMGGNVNQLVQRQSKLSSSDESKLFNRISKVSSF